MSESEGKIILGKKNACHKKGCIHIDLNKKLGRDLYGCTLDNGLVLSLKTGTCANYERNEK